MKPDVQLCAALVLGGDGGVCQLQLLRAANRLQDQVVLRTCIMHSQ